MTPNTSPLCVEPQEELARLAWDVAPTLCQQAHGCMNYHRSWGLVRLLLGHSQLPAGQAFFHRNLTQLAQTGANRVLVSGGADAGLLTIVLKAYREAGVEPDVVFIDRCETACEINKRMAHTTHAQVEIVQGDACDLAIAPVDAVVSHSFLPFLAGHARQAVLNAWSGNCKPGAVLLTSNVLKQQEADWQTDSDKTAITERAQALMLGAQGLGYAHHIAEDMVRSATHMWLSSQAQPPGLTETNLRAGLHLAGFGQCSIQYSSQHVDTGPRAMSRPHAASRTRAEIVAIKG